MAKTSTLFDVLVNKSLELLVRLLSDLWWNINENASVQAGSYVVRVEVVNAEI